MRRPARLERAGALTPRDRMWAAIRGLQITQACSWSPVEAQFLANLHGEPLHIDTVESYIRALCKAKPPYVVLLDAGRPRGRHRAELTLFRLIRDVGVDAPRVTGDGGEVTQGAGRDQMWRAMKTLKEFDYRELAAAASTEKHQVSPDEAQHYIRMLKLGGYLKVTEAAVKFGSDRSVERVRFIQSRNTGPRAPLVTRERCVMDGNTGAIVHDPRPSTLDPRRSDDR